MAKHVADDKTIDLVTPGAGVVRQRGRPVTGTALTPAQRQKARRERLRAAGEEEITVKVSAEVAAALRKFVEFKDLTLGEALTKIMHDRLLRKR